LPDLGHDELRERWKLLFDRPAPKSLRRKFMARAVAYQLQVAAYGGLSAATKRRLREMAIAVRNGDPKNISPTAFPVLLSIMNWGLQSICGLARTSPSSFNRSCSFAWHE
jgi:hypothetical protein